MGGVKESVAFKFTKKQISVGRSHSRAHSRAVFLKVVFGIKCEVIPLVVVVSCAVVVVDVMLFSVVVVVFVFHALY